MGTFGLPKTKKEQEKALKQYEKFQKLKEQLMNTIGDDILWDGLDAISDRIEELLGLPRHNPADDHRTEECVHPAFYGTTPGVCKDCRLNVESED